MNQFKRSIFTSKPIKPTNSYKKFSIRKYINKTINKKQIINWEQTNFWFDFSPRCFNFFSHLKKELKFHKINQNWNLQWIPKKLIRKMFIFIFTLRSYVIKDNFFLTFKKKLQILLESQILTCPQAQLILQQLLNPILPSHCS